MFDWSPLLLAVLGLFLAGVIKGVTGLGYASCSLPFLVIAIGLKPAMALVIIPSMTTNFSLALTTGHFRETITRFGLLYVSMLPGIAVGVSLLLWINPQVAARVLGAVIVAYGIFALLKPAMALPRRFERPLQIPTGFLNGVMTGMTGAQVMPLFPYVMALNLEPSRMIQAINLAVLIASTILAVSLATTGILTPLLLAASISAIIPALLGVELGVRARGLIPVDAFRRIVILTLIFLGLMLLAR